MIITTGILGCHVAHLRKVILYIQHICGWVQLRHQVTTFPQNFLLEPPRAFRRRLSTQNQYSRFLHFLFFVNRFTSQKVMTISSRDFCLFRRRIDQTICIGNPIENETSWFSKHLIFNRIPYTNRLINPTSKNRKFSTWNRHNFLTSEPILKNLVDWKIASIDSESIAGVLSSENQNKETFFLALHPGVLTGCTSTFWQFWRLGHYEAAQVFLEKLWIYYRKLRRKQGYRSVMQAFCVAVERFSLISHVFNSIFDSKS